MIKVTLPPSFAPYHLALADLVYHDISGSPNPVHASVLFWNALAGLLQRGTDAQQVEEFLARVTMRLSPAPTAQSTAPRFGGQSANKTLANVAQARKIAASFTPAPTPVQPVQSDPYALLLAQISIAQEMLKPPEAS